MPAESKAVDQKERSHSGSVDKVVGYKPGKILKYSFSHRINEK